MAALEKKKTADELFARSPSAQANLAYAFFLGTSVN
jgi:hypothetical protein